MKEKISSVLGWIFDLYYGTKSALYSPIEPHSTWTNIFYVIGGVFILINFPIMWFYGILMIVLGFSSFLYHGTKKYKWQNFDEIMMYYTFIGMINGILFLSGDISHVGYVWMTLIFGTVFAIGHRYLDSFIMMPILFLIAWILFFLNSGLLIYSIFYLVLFAFATLINLVGRRYKEKSFLFYEITHSVWHLLTAYGMTDIILKMDWSKIWII